jgi:hypothetical protein
VGIKTPKKYFSRPILFTLRIIMKKYLFSLAAIGMLSLVMIGCDDADTTLPATKAGTSFGPKLAMGQDSVQTFITTDKNGVATEIGIQFPSKAMNGIPANPAGGTFMIDFPSTIPAPWKFVMVNWNPQGHPPQPYLTPHFDIHFYMSSMTEVMAIAGGPDTTPIDTLLFPADYITDFTAVPMMGVHWVDRTAPELSFTDTSMRFDKTLIYGSYNGKATFVEPMIARKYLDDKGSNTFDIKQPRIYPTGLFPTKYNINYNAATDTYTVSLSGLVSH